MENLHLVDEEGYLIRAAMRAFYIKIQRNGLQFMFPQEVSQEILLNAVVHNSDQWIRR